MSLSSPTTIVVHPDSLLGGELVLGHDGLREAIDGIARDIQRSELAPRMVVAPKNEEEFIGSGLEAELGLQGAQIVRAGETVEALQAAAGRLSTFDEALVTGAWATPECGCVTVFTKAIIQAGTDARMSRNAATSIEEMPDVPLTKPD
jgi:hypothetical protein